MTIKRCPDDAVGTYTVNFKETGTSDDYHVKVYPPLHTNIFISIPGQTEPIAVAAVDDPTENAPLIESEVPWTGELCKHEIDWLEDRFNYSPYYRFTVTPV